MASTGRRPQSRPSRPARDGRGSARAPRSVARNTSQPHLRHRLILVLILLVALTISMRLVWVQGLNSDEIAKSAEKARSSSLELPAVRGDITDRNGNVLATGVQRYILWVNQQQVAEYLTDDPDAVETGPAAAAKQLAPVLGMSATELETVLTGDKTYKVIQKRVEPQVIEAVDALNIYGIAADPVQERIYPADNVAGNLVGFMGSDGTALGGVELAFDDTLRGTDGSYTFERGAGGQVIPSADQVQVAAVDGNSVELTIDRDIQFRSQELIASAVQQWGASSGSIVVLNQKTGEIYALAEYPTFNPNDPGATDAQFRGNQSISNVFEPGSTGKLFTFAALIEEGKAEVTDQVTVPSRQSFGGESIKDATGHATKQYTLAGVIKHSSNVGTVQFAQRLDNETRYEYLRAFGLGSKTGVELPGESAGVVHPADEWGGRTQYTTTFGHGYSVNALQVTSAVGTFGNGGVRVEPRIIKSITSPDGTVTPAEPGKSHRVVSEGTADTMLDLMDNAVDDDSSHGALVPNYAVGGKSGTAKVPDGTYTSSFIGMAPMDDPDVVIGVFLYGIHGFNSGTKVAAPVFGQIMAYTLQARNVAPTGVPGTTLENEWGRNDEDD